MKIDEEHMTAPFSHKLSSQKKADERKQRLAKALRENLRKRKEQAQLRQGVAGKDQNGIHSKS